MLWLALFLLLAMLLFSITRARRVARGTRARRRAVVERYKQRIAEEASEAGEDDKRE